MSEPTVPANPSGLTTRPTVPAQQALERLREGNLRFVKNVRSLDAMLSQIKRVDLVADQRPIATVLSCSDSRSPAEVVFDQGLGDLFVVRVAGNIVAPSQIGSVEFAARNLGVRLAVVMGHSHCGAVKATLEAILGGGEERALGMLSILDTVRAGIESLTHTSLKDDPPALLRESVYANVRAAADHLRRGSRLLEELILHDGLRIIGAVHNLETGEVDFFQTMEGRG